VIGPPQQRAANQSDRQSDEDEGPQQPTIRLERGVQHPTSGPEPQQKHADHFRWTQRDDQIEPAEQEPERIRLEILPGRAAGHAPRNLRHVERRPSRPGARAGRNQAGGRRDDRVDADGGQQQAERPPQHGPITARAERQQHEPAQRIQRQDVAEPDERVHDADDQQRRQPAAEEGTELAAPFGGAHHLDREAETEQEGEDRVELALDQRALEELERHVQRCERPDAMPVVWEHESEH